MSEYETENEDAQKKANDISNRFDAQKIAYTQIAPECRWHCAAITATPYGNVMTVMYRHLSSNVTYILVQPKIL